MQLKELRTLIDEVMSSIEIIETAEDVVNRNISEGVSKGEPANEISLTTQAGRNVLADEYNTLKTKANRLYSRVALYHSAHTAQNNGKPQQFDSVTPQQEYEHQEMEAIRKNAA